MRYPDHIWDQIERLYVADGKTAGEISRIYNGKPSKTAIHKRSQKAGPDGRTWDDKREEWRAELQMITLAPGSVMAKVMRRLEELLDKPEFGSKETDALAKLSKTFQTMFDESYHTHMVYHVLNDFLRHMKEHHESVLSEDLVAAIRDFKNEALDRVRKKQWLSGPE